MNRSFRGWVPIAASVFLLGAIALVKVLFFNILADAEVILVGSILANAPLAATLLGVAIIKSAPQESNRSNVIKIYLIGLLYLLGMTVVIGEKMAAYTEVGMYTALFCLKDLVHSKLVMLRRPRWILSTEIFQLISITVFFSCIYIERPNLYLIAGVVLLSAGILAALNLINIRFKGSWSFRSVKNTYFLDVLYLPFVFALAGSLFSEAILADLMKGFYTCMPFVSPLVYVAYRWAFAKAGSQLSPAKFFWLVVGQVFVTVLALAFENGLESRTGFSEFITALPVCTSVVVASIAYFESAKALSHNFAAAAIIAFRYVFVGGVVGLLASFDMLSLPSLVGAISVSSALYCGYIASKIHAEF